MTLILLTAQPQAAANRRLVEAGKLGAVEVIIADATRATAEIRGGGGVLHVEGCDLLRLRPATVLARVGNWRPETLLGLLEVAESAGFGTPNPAQAIRIGRDHWRTINCLSAAGLAVPPTLVGMDPEGAAAAAAESFGFPAVVKLRRSRMGIGVILCTARDHLESVLDSLWRVGDEFVVQKFVAPGGHSIRAFVVGDRVVAAAEFLAATKEWRSNGARGATVGPAELSRQENEMALAAARAIGLGICGVDLLRGAAGPVVCEVNPTPGFVRLEEATGIDVASAIVDFSKGAACDR